MSGRVRSPGAGSPFESGACWTPSWVAGVGLPVWITGPDRSIGFVNPRAEELLGRTAAECVGRPCFEVVAGRDRAGRRFCDARCATARDVERGLPIEPYTLELPRGSQAGRWVKVVVVPIHAPDGSGPWLIHFALPADRERRFEEFFDRVASRTSECGEGGAHCSGGGSLTRREREVLEHLARDEDLGMVAEELKVSYSTVRNHVQHILNKLGAHSILEAIALHLLGRDRR